MDRLAAPLAVVVPPAAVAAEAAAAPGKTMNGAFEERRFYGII